MNEVELPVIKERPSKTKQKMMAQATTKFAEKLVKLSHNQLNNLDLPDYILDQLLLAQRSKVSGGRKRLLKGVANQLRNDEVWGSEEAIKQYDKIAKGHGKLILEP